MASYYGISGSTCDEKKINLNEHFFEKAIHNFTEAENPYLLCGDFNINLEDSPAIAVAVNSGLAADIGHAWTLCTDSNSERPYKIPENTYSTEKPAKGMEEKGVCRIDCILAKPAAAVAIAGFQLKWGFLEESHVPLRIQIELGMVC